jgi:hypothetical protein
MAPGPHEGVLHDVLGAAAVTVGQSHRVAQEGSGVGVVQRPQYRFVRLIHVDVHILLTSPGANRFTGRNGHSLTRYAPLVSVTTSRRPGPTLLGHADAHLSLTGYTGAPANRFSSVHSGSVRFTDG